MNDPITIALVSALPSIGIGFWTLWRFYFERRDHGEQRRLSYEERQAKELDERQDSLSKRDAELMQWLRDDLNKARERIKHLEDDREDAQSEIDSWVDMARAWKDLCHDFKHDRDNSRASLNALLIRFGQPPIKWEPEHLPVLREILEYNLRHSVEKRTNESHGEGEL